MRNNLCLSILCVLIFTACGSSKRTSVSAIPSRPGNKELPSKEKILHQDQQMENTAMIPVPEKLGIIQNESKSIVRIETNQKLNHAYGKRLEQILSELERINENYLEEGDEIIAKVELQNYVERSINQLNKFFQDDIGYLKFEADSSAITKAGNRVLDKHSDAIKSMYDKLNSLIPKEGMEKIRFKIIAIGYASPDGSEEYNKELSEKRAKTIGHQLSGKLKHYPGDIIICTSGKGEADPLVLKETNHAERRTVILNIQCIKYRKNDSCQGECD